jgi:hypothetical protein
VLYFIPQDLTNLMILYGGFEAWQVLHGEFHHNEGDLKPFPRHESNFALHIGASTYWNACKGVSPPSLFPLFTMDERSMIAGGPFPISTVCVDVNPSNATFGFVSKMWGDEKSKSHYSVSATVHHFHKPLEQFIQLYLQWKQLRSHPRNEVKLKFFSEYLDKQWKN